MKIKDLPCFQHVRWNPSDTDLRRFAAAMIAGFALLGAIHALRSGAIRTPAVALWSIGATLAIAALIPALGRATYLLIYLPASIVGFVVSRVILVVLFALLFVPIGLFLKARGKDPLNLRWRDDRKLWRERSTVPNAASYYRQF